MNKHHPYNNIIEKKLGQLPDADSDHLWNDMHAILDKKMPQKKEKRRFIAWLFNDQGLLLLTTVSMIIAVSSLFFLSTQENPTDTIKKTAALPQPDKLIEDDATKGSDASKENITTTDEVSQKTNDNISAIMPLPNAVSSLINNNFTAQRKLKQSKKYISENQQKQSIQATISKDRAMFATPSFNLKSIDKRLLAETNHFGENNSLSRQQKPVIKMVKTNSRNNRNEFYMGIISGIDLSSIRFKSVKSGATKGLIIGYAFNQKWSIESGLLWDKKRVYDNGSNFNPPGYTPTSGVTIVAVNGKSRLYEWPVNIKYSIISGKHNLFTTAGLSSYFMRSESYDYEYIQTNQPGGHNYINYKNKTKNWLSVVNFSVGYSHKLGDIGSIRVEPYLKLPIRKLGVASMPIMSTGLNIGFIKALK